MDKLRHPTRLLLTWAVKVMDCLVHAGRSLPFVGEVGIDMDDFFSSTLQSMPMPMARRGKDKRFCRATLACLTSIMAGHR